MFEDSVNVYKAVIGHWTTFCGFLRITTFLTSIDHSLAFSAKAELLFGRKVIRLPDDSRDRGFSALHGMPARTSDEKGFCPSDCQTRAL